MKIVSGRYSLCWTCETVGYDDCQHRIYNALTSLLGNSVYRPTWTIRLASRSEMLQRSLYAGLGSMSIHPKWDHQKPFFASYGSKSESV